MDFHCIYCLALSSSSSLHSRGRGAVTTLSSFGRLHNAHLFISAINKNPRTFWMVIRFKRKFRALYYGNITRERDREIEANELLAQSLTTWIYGYAANSKLTHEFHVRHICRNTYLYYHNTHSVNAHNTRERMFNWKLNSKYTHEVDKLWYEQTERTWFDDKEWKETEDIEIVFVLRRELSSESAEWSEKQENMSIPNNRITCE